MTERDPNQSRGVSMSENANVNVEARFFKAFNPLIPALLG